LKEVCHVNFTTSAGSGYGGRTMEQKLSSKKSITLKTRTRVESTHSIHISYTENLNKVSPREIDLIMSILPDVLAEVERMEEATTDATPCETGCSCSKFVQDVG